MRARLHFPACTRRVTPRPPHIPLCQMEEPQQQRLAERVSLIWAEIWNIHRRTDTDIRIIWRSSDSDRRSALICEEKPAEQPRISSSDPVRPPVRPTLRVCVCVIDHNFITTNLLEISYLSLPNVRRLFVCVCVDALTHTHVVVLCGFGPVCSDLGPLYKHSSLICVFGL